MGVRARDKLSIRLDWVNIPYRNLYIAAAGAILLAIAGLYAFHSRDAIMDLFSRVRKEARVEITTARRLLSEASQSGREGRTETLRQNAEQKLSQAQREYELHDYDDARTSAIVSQNYSQKAIDMVRGDSGTQREVRFYKFEGEVRVKKSGEFRWEDASLGMMLRIGDQIKTGSHSVAQIIYFDGSMTTVRQESLLEIKDLYEEPTTRQRRVKEKLNWGELEATTRKSNVAGSFHEIQSDTASAKSQDDAEIKIAFDRTSNKGTVSLFSGSVDVSTSTQDVRMRGGETVAIEKDGAMGAIEKLLPAPRLLVPSDQKIFIIAAPKESSTTLAWEKVPSASRYCLQLSEQSLFSSLLLDKSDVRGGTVELPGLPAGAFYWRVAAIDEPGRPSPFSPSRKFRITTTETRDQSDKTPPGLAVQDFVQNGPYVILNGKTEPGATLWVDGERQDVDESGVFYAVVHLKHEGSNQVKVVAQDRAGNETRKTLEAFVDTF